MIPVELLTRRRAALKERIDESRALIRQAGGQGVEWLFLVEEEYRLASLTTEFRFVGRLIERLENPDHIRAWQASAPAASLRSLEEQA